MRASFPKNMKPEKPGKLLWNAPRSHDKSNENIDVTSKESPSTEIYYSTKISVKYGTDDLIQNKSLSRLHTTNMLDNNATVDDDSQYFETTRKNNHSATAKISQVLLGYDPLQFQHNSTTLMTG